MKFCLRLLAVVTAAGCFVPACGSDGGSADGSGGMTGSGGHDGSGGSGSGGSGSGGNGSGGEVGSGGSGSGGSSSGGASSGGSIGSGGSGSGGKASSGGVTGSGGQASGGNSNPTGGGGAMGGHGQGGAGGRVGSGGSSNGGATGSGGATGNGGATAFNPCPTNGDPCKVLPLGDSITFGIQYEGAYRVQLFNRAVMASKKITYVGSQMNGPATVASMPFPKSHEGWSGYTIQQMISTVISKDVSYKPHVILLHIGTNDMYMGDPGGAPKRLESLLDMLISMHPDALLVVAKIVPYPAQASNVNTYNATIPAIVQARAAMGKHILIADLNTGFTAAMTSSDGIHPNQTGYNFMGDAWYSVVSTYFH